MRPTHPGGNTGGRRPTPRNGDRLQTRLRPTVAILTTVFCATLLPSCSKEDGSMPGNEAATPAPTTRASAGPVDKPSDRPAATPRASTAPATSSMTPEPKPPGPATQAKIGAEAASRICREVGIPAPLSADAYPPEVMTLVYNAIERVDRERSADAIGELGAFYFSIIRTLDDTERCRACFEKANELDPESYVWPHMLGRLFVLRKSQERARMEFVRSAELNPEYPGNASWLGELGLAREDGAEAQTHFKRYLELVPDEAYGYVGLAEAQRLQGDLDGAVESLNAALKRNPNYARAHRLLAGYYESKGDERRAEMHLGVAERLPNSPTPLRTDPLEFRLMSATGPLPQSLSNIERYVAAQDIDSADLLIDALLHAYPENPTLLTGIAEIYLRLGRGEAAEQLARRAIKADPENPVAAVVLADCCVKKGLAEEGLKAADRAVSLRPDYAVGYIARGRALLALQRPDEALLAFKRAVGIEPDNFAMRNIVGEILLAQNALVETREWMTDTIRLGEAESKMPPAVATSFAIRGNVALREGKGQQAYDDFRAALAVDPTRHTIFREIVRLLKEKGQLNDALIDCRRLMDEHPSVLGYAIIYGDLLLDAGRTDEAIAHLERLCQDVPLHPAPHYALAQAYKSQGRIADALKTIDRALELQPSNEAYLLMRLDIAIAGKDTEEAMRTAREGTERVPGSVLLPNAWAWLLATSDDPGLRDPQKAIELAEQSVARSNRRSATILDTLACAYAAAGRFDDAVRTEQEAINIATEQKLDGEAAEFKSRKELFEKKQPYVDRN